MPETKINPKSLYVLAKALGRWDDEGGAPDRRRKQIPDQIWHSMQLKSVCCGVLARRLSCSGMNFPLNPAEAL
jgi:hypothetical protein